MKPTAIDDGDGNGWALEVVRGADAGRVFTLGAGEVVLGNALGGAKGLDLASLEGAAAVRKMAARHAALACSTHGLALRDLESPGGTFVNRRRVLPGQATDLRPGDLIQLGGVQLRVTGRPSPAAGAVPAPATSRPLAYPIPGGPTCRSWDEVLTASAQRWEALRDELASGRLAAYLVSIGLGERAPSPHAPGSPDDRLDDWLGSLPTARAARPELDVHPLRLVVLVTPGGGSVRRSIRVSNVGHRLLRSTARVDPPGTSWLALPTEFAGKPFSTVEATDLPVDIAIPATLATPLAAELVIEGNGASKRVAVVLEAKSARDGPAFEPGVGPSPGSVVVVGPTFGELVARQSPGARVATWGLIALAIRLLVGVASGSIGEDAMKASGPGVPGLGGVALMLGAVGALMLGAVGALIGGALARRRGGPSEIGPGSFAGGAAGVIAASAVVATCRAIEPGMGPWSTSVIAACGLWGAIGSTLGAVSLPIAKGKS